MGPPCGDTMPLAAAPGKAGTAAALRNPAAAGARQLVVGRVLGEVVEADKREF